MMKIVAMKRRDRIGMRNEIALPRKGAHDRPDDGAGGSVVLRARGVWVDAHDDERAERFDGVEIERRSARKDQDRTEKGMNLADAKRLIRFLGGRRIVFYILGI